MTVLRDLWRLAREMPDFYLDRFKRWAAELDVRRDAGELGKWPWQK